MLDSIQLYIDNRLSKKSRDVHEHEIDESSTVPKQTGKDPKILGLVIYDRHLLRKGTWILKASIYRYRTLEVISVEFKKN